MRINLIVANKYKLIEKIGSGSFGEVYKGVDIEDGKPVAIKLETSNPKNPHLLFESRVYSAMKLHRGIPKIYHFAVERNTPIMVMELLGPSLEDLFMKCGRRFNLKTTLLLADQMITRIQSVHNSSFIHRDIKPHNFLMGIPGSKTADMVYIIDFGLAKKYKDICNRHIRYRDDKSLTGTARYVSIHTHLGIEQSRRDDLEALGYVFVYFLRGSLPWQGLKATSKRNKYDKITEKKMSFNLDILCRNQPYQFGTFISLCRRLAFTETPDYEYYKSMFRILGTKLKIDYHESFDWTPSVNNENRLKPVLINSDSSDDIEKKPSKNQQIVEKPDKFKLDQNINHVITSRNTKSNCINYNYRLPQPGDLAVTTAVSMISSKTTDGDQLKCTENGIFSC